MVAQVFCWIDGEGRTLYWVAKKLNEMGIKAPCGGKWRPPKLIKVVRRHSYTGIHYYNANGREANPDRPLTDFTAEIKRTLVRPKPREEWAKCSVPALVDDETWQRVNHALTERGRGRGKQGTSIPALFRARMLCPGCSKPMSVLRKDGGDQIYYYCRAHYRPWLENPCTYNRFIPGTWDDEIWSQIRAMLASDAWLERQLETESSQNKDLERLLRFEVLKKSQAEQKIARVQDGWDNSIYTSEEAEAKIAKYRETIAKTQLEMKKLHDQMANAGLGGLEMDRAAKGVGGAPRP